MEVVIFFVCLFSKNLTVQSGLMIACIALVASSRQHTTSTLAHDTLQDFSCNNSLENSDKDPRHLFSYCRSYKTFIILLKSVHTLQWVFESLLCETWLRHLSNCIPVGYGLCTQYTGPFPFLWKWLGLACKSRAYITNLPARGSKFFIGFGTSLVWVWGRE